MPSQEPYLAIILLYSASTFTLRVHSGSSADELFLLCVFTMLVLQSCAPNRDAQLGACLKCVNLTTAA